MTTLETIIYLKGFIISILGKNLVEPRILSWMKNVPSSLHIGVLAVMASMKAKFPYVQTYC